MLAGCAGQRPLMMVRVPFSDLRAQPQTTAQPGIHDPLQETQLLYGERVRVRRVRKGWAQVEAVEQPEFTHGRRWQGYPGWLPAAALGPADPLEPPTIVVTEKWAQTWLDPYGRASAPWRFPLGARLPATDMGGELWKVDLFDGTRLWMPRRSAAALEELSALPSLNRRLKVVQAAEQLLGDAYYWGGRSPSAPSPLAGVAGVDCSGLVNLAYRAAGLDIPRDAHEQFLRARAVDAVDIADLIFLSTRDDRSTIVHVMLYAGQGEVIEGPGTGSSVRRITLQERLGTDVQRLAPGQVIDGQTIFFGAYLE